jgi:6-phosphogluconolactonase
MIFMMSKILFLLTLLMISSSVNADELLYVSSGGVLEVKRIDPKTGKLEDFQKVELQGMSKFTFSRNKKFLYAQATMKEDRKKVSVATYKVAADGKLSYVNNAEINGGTTELKTDHTDKFLAAADYQKGRLTIWKLDDGVYKGAVVQELILEKKAHAARFSPDNKMLMIPATGPNKIFQLAFDAKTGKIQLKSEALGPKEGALQPRHLVFHPTINVAYSTQERMKPGVATWKWDSGKGELKVIQSLGSSEDTTGIITNADLHISPDQKFLYVSSRDRQKEQDQIIAYKINPKDGTLTLVKKFSCENIPRSFCLNKSGDFVYVCGQKANKMGVYKVDKSTGHLSKVIQYETGKGPIWIETLKR